MLWLLLSFSAFAKDELDLKAVKALESELPSKEYAERPVEIERKTRGSLYVHPFEITSIDSILESGTEHGHVKAGSFLVRIKDNKLVELNEPFYGKFYRLQDDLGFKYIQSNDGSCIYKLKSVFFNSIEPELALFVPPLKYTPAPSNITRAEYDKKLHYLPEAALYLGMVEGSYMKDLFNDNKAETGTTSQFGIQISTDWSLPIKVGLAFHYEKSTYKLSNGGNILYSSPSIGPQFKTKNFEIWGEAVRFQTQFRVSPLARAYAQTSQGDITYKFNSADILFSAEHPVKNRFGEYVIGLFFQSQWLNIKDQPEIVSIRASNKPNNSFGLSLAQVFE